MPRHGRRKGRRNKGRQQAGDGHNSGKQQPRTQTSQEDMLRKAAGPLLVQLVSDAADIRHLACNSLAHITADPPTHATLIAMGITDPLRRAFEDGEHLAIQAEAAGCFRNLATNSNESVLAKVFDDGMLSALGSVLTKRVAEIDDSDRAQDEDLKLVFFDVIEQCCKTFSLLCESSVGMVRAMTSAPEMLANVAACIRPDVAPLQACCNAASCLLILSEDNPAFAEWLAAATGVHQHLLSLTTSDSSQPFAAELRLSAAGILANAGFTEHEDCVTAVVACVSQALAEDTNAQLASLVPALSQARQAEHNNFAAEEEAKLQATQSMLRAQCLGLEILTNLLSPASDDEEWTVIEEEEEEATGQKSMAAHMQEQEEQEQEAQGSMGDDSSPQTLALLQHMSGHGVQSQILARSQPLDAAATGCFTKLGEWGLGQLQQHHLLLQACANMVNNIAGAGPSGLSSFADVSNVWLAAFALLQHSNADVAKSAAQAAWSVLRAALQIDAARASLQIPREHLEVLFMVGNGQSVHEDIRIGCVGALACVAQLPLNRRDLTDLGKAIAHAALSDSSTWVRVEAVNGIFDAFAEADVGQEYTASGLNEAVPKLLTTLKMQRSMPEELRARVSEVRLNLKRFIEYKKQQ